MFTHGYTIPAIRYAAPATARGRLPAGVPSTAIGEATIVGNRRCRRPAAGTWIVMAERDIAKFVHGAADATAAIGSPRFWTRLSALFASIIRHHSCLVFRYSGAAPPEFVFGDLDSEVARGKFHEYRKRAYLLDPFYGLFRARAPDSVRRLCDVSADRFFHSVYFREYFRKTGLCDEIGVFCWLASDHLAIISLNRRIGERAFRRAEVDRIARYLPLIAAMIRLHEQVRDGGGAPADPAAAIPAKVPMLLPDGDLTPRERAIGELILRGHSSLSIALTLDISIETVRVHRRNLYRKLNVTSQAQLFALAIGGIVA